MQWQSRKSSSTFSGFAAGNDINEKREDKRLKEKYFQL